MAIMLDSTTELQLTKLLTALTEYKASDLHLTVANPPSLRIAGQLQPLNSEPLLTNDFIATVAQALLSDREWQQLQLKKDVVTAINFKGKARYKLHAYSQQGSTSLTFRYITPQVLPLSRLPIHRSIQSYATLTSGLVIVAGAYGSGKTSVLAGMVEQMNQTVAKHIMTFEQPLEYIYTDAKSIIEQVELGSDIPDLTSAIERVYQEDVDVIVVNTYLDASAWRAMFKFVQMGKLVLVEVPAPNLQAVFDSILGCFQSSEHPTVREELANSLAVAIAVQQLQMAGSVYLATEVLKPSTAVNNFIKHESFDKLQLVIENGRQEGMMTFQQSYTA